MAQSADLVARAGVYPAPDVVAYIDILEADLYARAGVYGSPDVIAYPWGTPTWAAAAGGSTLTLTPDPGAVALAGIAGTSLALRYTPAAGALDLAGAAPRLCVALRPAPGALTLGQGTAPSLDTGGAVVSVIWFASL